MMIVNSRVVLLLKASSDSPDLSYDLTISSLNLEAVTIPPVTFEWQNLTTLANHLYKPDCFSGLVLTSQRSVLAIAECLKHPYSQNVPVEPWKQKTVFVVGAATHSAAENVLGLQAIGKESGNATALAKSIIEYGTLVKNQKLLFPCSSLKQETLPTMLRDNDISVECVECYRTTPHPEFPQLFQELIKSKGVPAYFVFFSPSGVKSVLPVMKDCNISFSSIKFLSIGPATSQCLTSLGLPCAATASSPDPQGLKTALLQLGITEEPSSES